MKPAVIALAAGAVAAFFILRPKPAATPARTGLFDRVQRFGDDLERRADLVGTFFDESYNYAVYGHPSPTTAAIPAENSLGWWQSAFNQATFTPQSDGRTFVGTPY